MKIRQGFVSNSSSSSFVCDICNRDGLDVSGDELDMYKCDKYHIICNSHMTTDKNCPICNMDVITNEDLLKFLLAQGIDRKLTERKIKEDFPSYTVFNKFINSK